MKSEKRKAWSFCRAMVFALFALAFFAFFGCDAPTNSDTKVTYDTAQTENASDEIPKADTSKNTDSDAEREEAQKKAEEEKKSEEESGENEDSEKDALGDFDSYVIGFDASAVDYYENNGDEKGAVTWKDTDGTTIEFFALLAKYGYNTVRLRIWNDPSKAPSGADTTGDNTLERTISMAKRIKSAGLKLMLDFHYSDTWADPSRQIVPSDWQSLTSVEAVANAISEYTTKVLTALKEQAAVTPYYVQIGNEINNGLLLHTGYNSSTTYGSGDFAYAGEKSSENVVTYLAAASKAVRDFNQNIRIVVHVTSSNSPTILLDKLKTGNLDYDVIGLSYYPWENHGTIAQMKNNVSSWKTTYGKDVLIAETSFYCADNDNGTTYTKDITNLTQAKSNLIDPSTGAVYADLDLDSESKYVRGSVSNQTKVLVHVNDTAKEAGSIGIFTWGGEIRDWSHGMFTWGGVAYESIGAFKSE